MQHVEQNAPRGVGDHLRRAMARLSHFVSAAIHCCKKLFTGTNHPQPSLPFPNTQHKFSDADVTRALEMWNASAQQAALALTEDFAPYFQSGSVADPRGQEASAVRRVSAYVIPDLVISLATKSDDEVVALLRTAFEACLAFALYQTASVRELKHGRGASVDGVDQRLHAASESAKYSTRFVLLTVAHPESRVIEHICDVLFVAGCTTPRSDVESQLTSEFHGNQASLFDVAARRLIKMLDDMAPRNFEVFIARPHNAFDSETMEEAEGNKAEGESVLCTTAVGLRRELEVVLKAEVLLKSFLG